MLRITVELWPYGDESRASTIATMNLWNNGTGTREFGNYEAQATILPSAFGPIESRGGKIVGYDRKKPVWNLISLMLKELGYAT